MSQPPIKVPPKDFSDIQAVKLQNALPAKKIPYFIRNDEGERHLIGGMVLNVIARAVDTDSEYEMMTWSGGKGANLPFYRLANSHQALYVLEGQVEFWLDDKHYLLNVGDYASIPAGIQSALTMTTHRTKLLLWATGSDVYQAMTAMGVPFDGHIQPENAVVGFDDDTLAKATAFGTLQWHGKPTKTAFDEMTLTQAPDSVTPYVLRVGEGERYVVGDQLFVYLGDSKSSNGRFIALITEGPKGEFVPPHFHAEHTEIFYPLVGTVTMIGNGDQLVANPNDVVHIPAGTIHSYKLNDHYTKFIGFLTPSVFDDFFRTLGDPYDGYVYPNVAGELQFGRVIQKINELDLYLLGGKPPQKP